MRTVERRSCSAISPKPGMAMLLSSMRAFANDNVGFLKSPAANEFERQGFPNGFGAKLPVNVFKTSDGIAGESHKNVANDDAMRVNGRAANGRRLHADVEANVRSKRCASPSATLRDNQTYGAEGSYRAAGARAPDNQREAAGLDCGDVARFHNG